MNFTTQKSTNEQGVALIAAIFLIVVIGLSLTLMSTLAIRNSQQNTQSLLLIRATSAANSAIEYSTQKIIESGTCTHLSDASFDDFSGFVIDLSCNKHQYNQFNDQISLFEVTVTVTYGAENNADYVQTKITSTIEL